MLEDFSAYLPRRRIIFIFMVGTHQPLGSYPHVYPSFELCQKDSFAATDPGRTYAVCKPQ